MTIIGNNNVAAGNWDESLDSFIVGCDYVAPITGKIISISMYINPDAERPHQCAIYSQDRATLIAQTEERTIGAADYAWETFNFAVRPTLTQGTTYYLMGWSGGGGNTNIKLINGDAGKLLSDDDHVYDSENWPADLSGDDTYENFGCLIYGTYQEVTEKKQTMTLTGDMIFPNIKYTT